MEVHAGIVVHTSGPWRLIQEDECENNLGSIARHTPSKLFFFFKHSLDMNVIDIFCLPTKDDYQLAH